MPYINGDRRKYYEGLLKTIEGLFESIKKIHYFSPTVGELNYLITKICLAYLSHKGENYQTYNDIIGVLECCKQELYRKKISKYEDKKEKENGTIF